ncbi:DUF362 domain-containing protein [Alkalibacter saccharofermentans]|uniref:Ferredoxin n=1 Tax=Alkalibacter saccharofermentans DSM 14828 TaxID=1120975 RepID=A0A1M4YN36_9FIRM|nr:DUF362 domain-containing protein [Alkalibacter saccharofermentans]SHF07225.1 Uncharacterized conserved protein, DUF362 family [Alkalibacter saccharofermentans DSM 14828]
MKEKVALLRCASYDVDIIEEKIKEGFSLLGGEKYIKDLIPFGSKVLLKPNLLSVEEENSPVVTNHAFFEAVVRVIKDYTDNLIFGDSPGFGSSEKAAQKAGLMDVAKRYGVGFDPFTEKVSAELKEAILVKNWDVAKVAYEADVLISLPKLKTHGMMYFTGAVKNQFGCVPGTQKALWHTRMNNGDNFSKMLLDLNKLVKTDFAIMDGIIAMEGNGPKSGTPKKMDSIIMGESLTAVDSTALGLIGYEDPREVPQYRIAHEFSWGKVLPEDILILGESLDEMKVKDFKKIRRTNEIFGNSNGMKFIKNLIAPYPKLLHEKCISCNRCYEVCPEKPRVIEMVEKNGKSVPVFDKKTCIRCFCCQELCPVGALEVGETLLGKMIYK